MAFLKVQLENSVGYLHYSWNMLTNYCAARQPCYFSMGTEHPSPWHTDAGRINSRPIQLKNIVKAIITKERTAYGILFFGDKKGGTGDTYILEHAPTKPFMCKGMLCTPTLSEYYLNRNSGNMCRHLIVHTVKLPAKKKA